MDKCTFSERFKLALNDFEHERRIKDELAAYASAQKYQLCAVGDRLPPKSVVHQIMLAAAYPGMLNDAIDTAYSSFPR